MKDILGRIWVGCWQKIWNEWLFNFVIFAIYGPGTTKTFWLNKPQLYNLIATSTYYYNCTLVEKYVSILRIVAICEEPGVNLMSHLKADNMGKWDA